MIVTLVVFLTYIAYIVGKFGVLPSISDSWYKLGRKEQVLFTLFMWGISIPIIFQGGWLFFLAGSAGCFVGVATEFKMKYYYTKLFHFLGAVLLIVLTLVGIGLQGYWLPLIGCLISVVVIAIFKKKNRIWWIEMVSFAWIIQHF